MTVEKFIGKRLKSDTERVKNAIETFKDTDLYPVQ